MLGELGLSSGQVVSVHLQVQDQTLGTYLPLVLCQQANPPLGGVGNADLALQCGQAGSLLAMEVKAETESYSNTQSNNEGDSASNGRDNVY